MTSRFSTGAGGGNRVDGGADPAAGAPVPAAQDRSSGPATARSLLVDNDRSPAAGEESRAVGRPDPGPPGAGVQAVQQPGSGLGMIVSLAVAAIVFVLAIYAIRDPNANRLPIAQTTQPLYWIIAVLAVGAAGAGAQYAERVASRAAAAVKRPRSPSALASAWTVPAIATGAAVFLIATYHNPTMLVAGPLLAFLGNAGALLARDLLDDAGDTAQRTATAIHTLVIHAVAFFALSAIYLNKLPTPVSALLVGVVAGLLTLEVLERGDAAPPTRLLYAALAGGLLAEATVALNWWQTHGWSGGAVLLVGFYLVSSVLLARTQRAVIRPRDLLELGLVGGVAFAVLALTA